MNISGAGALLKCLIGEHVDTIFGYPGGGNIPLYDALYDYSERLHHILVRHEQGAVHAAEGYARITGKPGVCFATSGPGATNLVTGIADAMMDSVPIVCVTGQVPAHLIGTNAFQEVDIVGITKPITKWNVQITKMAQVEEAVHAAFAIVSSGRPGPVLIDIAKSAQLEIGNYIGNTMYSDQRSKIGKSRQDIFIHAAELLNTAKRPLIIVGHGILISNAQSELLQFVEKTNIPVACTLLGLTAINSSHPSYVGMVGMHGNYGPNMLTNEADVILAIGMRFDDRVTSVLSTYAKKAKIIHIDIDLHELNKNVKVAIPIHSDAKYALKTLIPLVEYTNHLQWFKNFKIKKDIEFKKVIGNQINPKMGRILMAEVVNNLSELTKSSSTIVADVGQNQMVAARYFQFEKNNTFITSGGLGTMGFALPGAIGAYFGDPTRDVITIMGDGGFQMNMQELGTIMQEKIPIKIIILNNGYLGMVRQWQELFYKKRYSFTSMNNPNFVMIAQSYGIKSKKISDRKLLYSSLKDMLNYQGPYLLEIVVEQEENVFPMIAPGKSVSQIQLS